MPSRGALEISAAVLVFLALGYLAARVTPLFAVHEVDVRGAPPGVSAEVREVADNVVGTSLVSLDGDGLVARLEALPSVRSVAYDRAFPHTLQIDVIPERPLAVVRTTRSAWLVSARGRVIRRVGAGAARRYPRIELQQPRPLAPGELVAAGELGALLATLALVPRDFPVDIRAARADDAGVTLTLRRGAELRLGDASDLSVKLLAAARVLDALTAAERAAVSYLDVSVPERPVSGSETLNPEIEP